MDGAASKRVWSMRCFWIFCSSDTRGDVSGRGNPTFRSSFVSSCSVVYMSMRCVPAIPVMYYTFFWHLCKLAPTQLLMSLCFRAILLSRTAMSSWLSFESLAVCDFGLPQPRNWGLRSSGMLRNVDR